MDIKSERHAGRVLALCVIAVLAVIVLITNSAAAADGSTQSLTSDLNDVITDVANGGEVSVEQSVPSVLPQMYPLHSLHAGRSWRISHL